MELLDRVAEIGGADPGDPLEPGSRLRHLGTGGLLVAFFAWGLFSVSVMVHKDFQQPWHVAVFFGLLFAIAVFLIDMTINCIPLKEDTTGHRLRLLFTRGLLSLAIGLVISQSTLLIMFGDRLAAIVERSNEVTAQADASWIKAHNDWSGVISSDQGVLQKDLAQIVSDEKQLTTENSNVLRLQGQFDNETECLGNGRAPDGDFCRQGPIADQIKQTLLTQQGLAAKTSAQLKADQQAAGTLNATISADQDNLNNEIQNRTAADLNNTGLIAQSDALVTLLRQDVMAWIWPILFVAFDLTIVLMKAVFPESDFDRARRRERELDDLTHRTLLGSAEWEAAAATGRHRFAEVEIRRIDAKADRQIATIDARARARKEADERRAATGSLTGRARRWRLPRTRPARLGAGVALLIALGVVLPNLSLGTSGHAAASQPMSATGGGSINLRDEEKLAIPVGAISGNARVTAAYTAPHAWQGNTPASREVTFNTEGKIVGKPVLTLQVPASQTVAASNGALVAAFWSSSTQSWTPYQQTSYDPRTHTLSAVLTHFSTWRFWTSSYTTELTAISQATGQWEGRRATTAPDCGTNGTPPNWVQRSTGVDNGPELPVRACMTTQPGSDVLDVELVNNRPYGLMLDFGGATVQWAAHDAAKSLADGLRDAAGDAAAKVAHGLYLPPLSGASVGVADSGPPRNLTFTIAPTRGTILADALDLSLGPLVKKTVTTAATAWGRDVFAEAAGSCAAFLTTFPVTALPDQSTVMSVLTGAAPECIKNVLAIAASSKVATDSGLAESTSAVISAASNVLEKIITIGEWADIEDKLGKVLDFTVDRVFAAAPDLGYGFSIVAA